MSLNTTNTTTMKGYMSVRIKIIINDHMIEQVNSFNYSGYTITVTNCRDFRFDQMCSTVRRMLNDKITRIHRYNFIEPWWYLQLYCTGNRRLDGIKKQEAKIETAEIKYLERAGPIKKH
jgi:hypothetical protein